MVWSGGGQSPAAGRDRQGNAGKAWLTQPSQGRNQSNLRELCSEPDLVAVINGLRSSWERAGDGEGAQSRAGSTTVEERDRVLAPRGQGTPRAPCCKEGTGKGHPEGKEGAAMEHRGAARSQLVSTHGCGGRQAVEPID